MKGQADLRGEIPEMPTAISMVMSFKLFFPSATLHRATVPMVLEHRCAKDHYLRPINGRGKELLGFRV